MTPSPMRASSPWRDRPARRGSARPGQQSPMRESPARSGSVQSGRGEARPVQRNAAQRRSPPPSARKRHIQETASVETPAAKRKPLHISELGGERSDISKHHDREADVQRSLNLNSGDSSGLQALQQHYDSGVGDDHVTGDHHPAVEHDAIDIGHGVESDDSSFAHLLFGNGTDLSQEEVADSAAKVNTWRNLPARARPKLAELLIGIIDRATRHDCSCCADVECRACQRALHAWQEIDYIFQVLVRNTERSNPSEPHKVGPKVDIIIRDRIQQAITNGWKGLVEEYHADAALRYKQDLDRGQPQPPPRILGQPVCQQDADAFCRNAKSLQSSSAASSITAAHVLPDSERLQETLREKISPVDQDKAAALMKLRKRRLGEMQSQITPGMIHALDEALAIRAERLRPFKKAGRTGWRNEFIRQLHATRAGPALRRLAIHFLLGRAPLQVYIRYGHVSLGPRDKGRGADDPRPVGSPEPFWRWAVGAGRQVVQSPTKRLLYPHQYAIGVSNGAEKMGKQTSFDAAQLPNHQFGIPDVRNAYNELDREEACNDMCEVHPLSGCMVISLYTVPTVYVHDVKGAKPRKYPTAKGVIQGCNVGMDAFCISQRKPIEWIGKTAQAAGSGLAELPAFDNEPPATVKGHMQKWLSERRMSQPTSESSVVVHRHYADNGTYGMVAELMQHFP